MKSTNKRDFYQEAIDFLSKEIQFLQEVQPWTQELFDIVISVKPATDQIPSTYSIRCCLEPGPYWETQTASLLWTKDELAQMTSIKLTAHILDLMTGMIRSLFKEILDDHADMTMSLDGLDGYELRKQRLIEDITSYVEER